MDNIWNTEKQELDNVRKKRVRKVISTFLGLIGFVIILSQLFPILGSIVSGKVYEIRASIMAKPIPDSHKEYISGEFAFYNPGQSYFQNLIRNAQGGGQPTEYYDPISKTIKDMVIDSTYNRSMSITVLGAGITNINVTPNVESYDEDVYNIKLKNGLAHFKGTPIPGDGGNSFIYGHSAVPSFFKNNQNLPETIFSKLGNVDIGFEVIVKKDGKELKYIVRNKKITEPNDFSILQQDSTKETLTMMTCWPLGVPSKRLIVVAERYE